MKIDKSSVAYMKDYLRYAIEFEKYVYIWSRAMDEANVHMRHIYSERERLENIKANAKNTPSANRRQTIILQAKESEAESGLVANALEEYILNDKQEDIHKALQEAKSNLMKIYAENVLPQKYRTFNAVVTLYEYLETGRCNTIQGHGGIYDTYEVERLQIAQLQQMVQMNATLSRMEDNQRYICQELRQANRTLSSINSSLNEIKKTNAEIAKNTAISAAAEQQTAAATQWIAWNMWVSG